MHATFEMFVNSRTWYSEPAAPCEFPALTDRSRVAQPEPEPPEPPEPVAEADAPPEAGDDAEEDEDATVRGVRDAEGAPEVADDDAAVPVPPAVVAGVGVDPGDAVQPAAAATAATAVTMPATRSSSELEPVIPNHPSSVPRPHYDDAVRLAAVGRRLSQSVRGM